MWKKEDRERHSRRVLTAGENRVTADRRFNVLHDAGETPPGVKASREPNPLRQFSTGFVWLG
jgi:hypothetical protein